MKDVTVLSTIYALTEPDTGEIRYIGCTRNPTQRYRTHVSEHRTWPRKQAWVRQLITQGKRPGLRVLEGPNPTLMTPAAK